TAYVHLRTASIPLPPTGVVLTDVGSGSSCCGDGTSGGGVRLQPGPKLCRSLLSVQPSQTYRNRSSMLAAVISSVHLSVGGSLTPDTVSCVVIPTAGEAHNPAVSPDSSFCLGVSVRAHHRGSPVSEFS